MGTDGDAAETRVRELALVTGANTGIGKVVARVLAGRDYRVIMACRNQAKAEAARAEIVRATGNEAVEILPLDLGSLVEVRRAAERFLATERPLAVLVNNAGLAGTRGTTADGFEVAFGTNHLGPYLFTRLLLPRLRAAGSPTHPARIINVASKAHLGVEELRFDRLRRPTRSLFGYPEYAASKLANVLFTRSLAARLGPVGEAKVLTYAVHPGVVASDIWRRIPWPLRPLVLSRMIGVEQGAEPVWRCLDRRETGAYYDRHDRVEPSPLGRDDALAESLWERSASWAGLPAELGGA